MLLNCGRSRLALMIGLFSLGLTACDLPFLLTTSPTEVRVEAEFNDARCGADACQRDDWVEFAVLGGGQRTITWPELGSQPVGLAASVPETLFAGDMRPGDLLTAAITRDGALLLLPIGSTTPTATLPVDERVTLGVAWSSDGERLAVLRGSYPASEATLELRTATLELLGSFPIPLTTSEFRRLFTVSWSADDALLLVSSHPVFSPTVTEAVLSDLSNGAYATHDLNGAHFIGMDEVVASTGSRVVRLRADGLDLVEVGRIDGADVVLDSAPSRGVFLTQDDAFGFPLTSPRSLRTAASGPDRITRTVGSSLANFGALVIVPRGDVERVLGPLDVSAESN
ncbi:MAG: hypothetical protein J5J06_15670 [Phycisphaerae bacterium]|nr:hypothetical protein [Phycisphaerae bacterium]